MKTESLPSETPLMRQYRSLKASYPHAILFFRLGDFYEMFEEDAKTASSLLGIVLTSRHGIPMCGIPAHSSSNYISKLLRQGRKIAICEQVAPGDAADKSRIFKRQVVRLITPGTVVEDALLDSKTSNHLVCVETDIVGWGIACVEVSTGEFWAAQALGDPGFKALAGLISKLDPSELLASPKSCEDIKNIIPDGAVITPYSRTFENPSPPEQWPDRSVWENHKIALKAALKAASYVEESEPHLKGMLVPSYREPGTHMQLDETAIRTLELVRSAYGNRQQTLWGTLDNTRTPMGSRMLKSWILQPLTDIQEIERRQSCVEELVENSSERETLAGILSGISDIERVMSRVATASATPRDVGALGNSLGMLGALKEWINAPKFSAAMSETAVKINTISPDLDSIRELLSRALSGNPPMRISDGGVIRENYNGELDELRSTRKNSQSVLLAIESREKKKTGITSLKVGYNSVFGYYMEVTRPHLAKVPQSYVRKQTLVNAERFITQELKEMESKILGAEDRIAKLEAHLFEEVKATLLKSLNSLKEFAKCVAELDVFYSFAVAAVRGDYARPKVDIGNDIVFEDARHPIVERSLPAGSFVPNNLKIGSDDPQIIILTGPNMSGKSVYLRQNALAVIMAQIGSFVPARSARVGIVDRIMTRIGAHDALSRGDSTFMVEMKETAAILASLTPRSLILLDEIGRGTSTFDGISIAWAVIEYLNRSSAGPKVLFATHYFELTELAEKFAAIKNFNVEVREWTNVSGKTEVVFLHKIAPGPADKSYGIHVAELAGLPASSINRARKILQGLERKTQSLPDDEPGREAPLLPFLSSHPVLDEIKLSTPEKMTPLEALSNVAEWKKRIQ